MATCIWLSDALIVNIKSGLVQVNLSIFKSVPPLDDRGKLLQPQYIHRVCTLFEAMIDSHTSTRFDHTSQSFEVEIHTKGHQTPDYVCEIKV